MRIIVCFFVNIHIFNILSVYFGQATGYSIVLRKILKYTRQSVEKIEVSIDLLARQPSEPGIESTSKILIPTRVWSGVPN